MANLLNELLKSTGNEFVSIVEDGIDGGDITGFIDTGSYAFNALISGSIYGGIPNNKITAFAGEQATGKTFFALSIVKNFLELDPKANCLYFDTESALTKQMFIERNIDPKRVAVIGISTVEEFKNQVLQILNTYEKLSAKEKKPIFIVLDSLGMLSTNKEMADAEKGSDKKDMTRAQIIKSAFRVLTLKCGKLGVPILLTNHTYDVIGSMFPTKEMGGGGGLKYAASTIIFLGKKKDKDGAERVGSIIPCKTYKSRLTKEEMKVEVRLRFDTGLQPYDGLLELAEAAGIFKKVSTKYEINGKKYFAKTIMNDPETYFTQDILDQIEEFCPKYFGFGSTVAYIDGDENGEEEEQEEE